MSLPFTTRERIEPGKPGGGQRKHYAIVQPPQRVGLDQLSEVISRETTLSRTDVVAVLEALIQVLPRYLIRGCLIDLGRFGTFRLSLRSRGENTAKQVTNRSILGNRLLFRPGKALREAFAQLVYKKVS